MATPTTRILALLELLQTHGLMSGSDLARRLEVDPRTLRRYIRTLESLGVPVKPERGRDGGYRLMQGYKLPPMMFSNDEALALALGLVASRDLGMAAAAPAGAGALAKLERVMPDNLRQRVRAVSETVTLDIARATAAAASDADLLGALGAAAQQQQGVRLDYLSPQQVPTSRDVDPYGLAYLGGKWYVVGHCHLREDTRSFRLDRIQGVRALPASFGRPAGFDAMAYMTAAITSLPRAHSVKALLRTDLAAARAAIFTTLGLLEPVAGGTMLHSQVDDLNWMARELARLPFAFAIQEPQALRDALARHAAALLESLRRQQELHVE